MKKNKKTSGSQWTSPANTHPFRVFISYSHDDIKLVRKLVSIIGSNKLIPIWDDNIQPGSPLTTEIRDMIDHVHVFIPFITRQSSQRPWVHQETGYAIAREIPVLPICYQTNLGEMISDLMPLYIKNKEMSVVSKQLTCEAITAMVLRKRPLVHPFVEIAHWHEERTERLGRFTTDTFERLNLMISRERSNEIMSKHMQIRQWGALSTFCIPNKGIHNKVWKCREGTRLRGDYTRTLALNERLAFECYVRKYGCFLVIDPDIDLSSRGPYAKQARIETLYEFLKSIDDNDKVRIVCCSRARSANRTIVGDWYFAQSIVPTRGGYRETEFTWHAPTVYQEIRKFDQQFQEMSEVSGWGSIHSKEMMIKELEKIMKRMTKCRDYKCRRKISRRN